MSLKETEQDLSFIFSKVIRVRLGSILSFKDAREMSTKVCKQKKHCKKEQIYVTEMTWTGPIACLSLSSVFSG